MDALEKSFVQGFLDFLNDKDADARRAEARFMRHPYVSERLELFKVSPDVKHYLSLRESMWSRLTDLLKKGLGDAGRKDLADALNRLQFDGLLLVETPEGKKIDVLKKIGAIVEYMVERRRVVLRIYPTISGMEGACEYALMLIQSEPGRVRLCPWQGCGRFFNTQTSGQRGFCSRRHAKTAEKENAKVRAWNSKHPDEEPEPVPYRTTKPKRKKS